MFMSRSYCLFTMSALRIINSISRYVHTLTFLYTYDAWNLLGLPYRFNKSICFWFPGDEVLAVNGQACHELAHVEALALFKAVRNGPIELRVCRRAKNPQ